MELPTRDYNRVPSASFGRIRIESVSTRLVLLTVATFLLDRVFLRLRFEYTDTINGLIIGPYPPMLGLGHFSAGLAFFKLELWRCFSWPFVHVLTAHLLVNVAGLHFFGPILESHYGSKRFLAFYILCGAGCLVAYLAMWATKHLFANPWVPLYGGSGPVLGVLVAAAHVAPNTTTLIYGTIPIKLRTLAIALLGLTVYTTFAYGGATATQPISRNQIIQYGGAAAHLGGAAVGLILIRSPEWVRLFQWNPFRRPPPF